LKNKQRDEALTGRLDARNYSFKIRNRTLFTFSWSKFKVVFRRQLCLLELIEMLNELYSTAQDHVRRITTEAFQDHYLGFGTHNELIPLVAS